MEPATKAELVDEHALATLDEETGQEVNELSRRAEAFEITSPESADAVAAFRNLIVERRKRIEEWFKDPVDAAFKAHRALTDKRREALARYEDPERIVNDKLKAWNKEQERLRREAEEAAERERERQMEEDRLQRALEAEQAGDKGLAERIVDGRTPTPVPHVPVAAPPPRRVAGVTFAKKYRAEVVDVGALIRAAGARPEWQQLLAPNMAALNKLVAALGPATAVPGVRVVEDAVVRGSGTRR